jgi:hypothetical protein
VSPLKRGAIFRKLIAVMVLFPECEGGDELQGGDELHPYSKFL